MDLFFGLVALFFLSFLLFLFLFFITFNFFLILITLFYLFIFFLSFFLSLFSSEPCVLWLGVRPAPLRWETQIQDIGPQGTTRLHVISNGESSPRDCHINTKTKLHSMTSKLQCWALYAKQLARQEHNVTY